MDKTDTWRQLQRRLNEAHAPGELRPLSGGLESGAQIENANIESLGLADTHLPDLVIDRSILRQVDLSRCQWRGLRMAEVLLERGTLTGGDLRGCRLDTVKVRSSRLTGCNFAEAKLQNVVLEGCKLDLALFHDAQLRDCCFEKCQLTEADFQGAALQRVVLRNCDLRQARFPAAKLSELDLRGSQLAGMFVEPTQLRGTIVDAVQVADFAELLGLKIEPLSGDDA